MDRQAARRLNALIPREVRIPEGSGDRRRGRPNREVEVQRAPGREAAATGANREAVVELNGPNGHGSELGRKRSSRLGALTPEWRSPRGGSRCGRAKSRYERPVPGQRRPAASQEALIRGLEKTAIGERRGETSGMDSDHRPALTTGTEKTTVPFPGERAEEKQILLPLAREATSSTKSALKAPLAAPSRGTLDLSLVSVAPERQVWLRWHRQV